MSPSITVVATLMMALHITFMSAPDAPFSPLCKDGSYRSAHPLICDTGATTPGTFPGAPGGGGGGGSGGLLGTIGDALGGLL